MCQRHLEQRVERDTARETNETAVFPRPYHPKYRHRPLSV